MCFKKVREYIDCVQKPRHTYTEETACADAEVRNPFQFCPNPRSGKLRTDSELVCTICNLVRYTVSSPEEPERPADVIPGINNHHIAAFAFQGQQAAAERGAARYPPPEVQSFYAPQDAVFDQGNGAPRGLEHFEFQPYNPDVDQQMSNVDDTGEQQASTRPRGEIGRDE